MSRTNCKYCGKENPSEAIFCMQCGSRLKGETVQENRQKSKVKKELNIKFFYYLVPFTVILGILVLYLSGVFDSPQAKIKLPVENKTTEVQTQSVPVVDLKTAQELKSMEDFIKTNPNDLNAILQLGHKYFDISQFDKARDKYLKYIAINSNDPDVLVDLGVCYYNLIDYANAEKYMKMAIEINPKHQIGLLNLGIVSSAQNKILEAKEFWQIAYDIAPNSAIGQRAKNFIDK